jgi:excisionase family DNA binding protein
LEEHRPFPEVRFVTVNEVAEALRVSRMTVYRLIKQGELPAVRVGSRYRVSAGAVDRYLQSRYEGTG